MFWLRKAILFRPAPVLKASLNQVGVMPGPFSTILVIPEPSKIGPPEQGRKRPKTHSGEGFPRPGKILDACCGEISLANRASPAPDTSRASGRCWRQELDHLPFADLQRYPDSDPPASPIARRHSATTLAIRKSVIQVGSPSPRIPETTRAAESMRSLEPEGPPEPWVR